MIRKKTKVIKIGNVKVGGDNPVLVQSMTNTVTSDVKATVQQILKLEKAGCEIIRAAVPDMAAAQVIDKIKAKIHIPLVADIHFNYKLALEVIERGIDKVRINPGNIGKRENIKKVVEAANKKNIPIRIGVNSGSLEKEFLAQYGSPTPEALVDSALKHVRILERFDFKNIVVSIKASNLIDTVMANTFFAHRRNYPLHLGVTEAGTSFGGTIKSSIGIGSLLLSGIGDTIRVSLTADPREEVKIGHEILKILGLRERGIDIVSCPTCARTKPNINVIKITKQLEKEVAKIKKPPDIKIAVMGCAVNGPGEAKEADLAIAGTPKGGILFVKGKKIKRVNESRIIIEFMKLINNFNF